MCGIAGFFSATSNISREVLQLMSGAIAHRGPDAEGFYYSPDSKIGLAHRRLSIIDLSTAANQPIFSASGRYAMIYNGEVYNFQSLQSKLPHFNWKTHSDTEVILELFEAHGPAVFSWLNGMFAIAIYDTETAALTIARDQLGIKPLFYYWNGTNFLYSSELKSIQQAGILDLKINSSAIPYFLHLGFIPQPMTIYEQVFKFPTAHYAVIDSNTITLEFHRFWNAEDYFLSSSTISEEAATKTYQKLLYSAVETQMISDVPLGTFLSGGIDSSLVTAVASKVSKQKIQTFSIGFKDKKYDESSYATAIANHLGSNHNLMMVDVAEVLDLVPNLLDVYDEPFADSSALPTMLVSKMARQNVTVTLSGDGGDETFQGYGMYRWAMRLNNPILHTFRRPIYVASQLMAERYKRAGTLLNYEDKSHLHSHIFSQEQYQFSEQELSEMLIDSSFNFDEINKPLVNSSTGNAAERQAFWDLNYYLKDDLLVKVDRASMQYSLETRVPLLDTRLIEFAMSLPYDMKVREGYGTKYLMKKTLYELVPKALFDRPKRGFSIPLGKWLKGDLKYLITDCLNPTFVNQCGLVKQSYVSDLLVRFNQGEDYLYNRIWLLVVLHWWMKKNLQPA